MYDKIEDTESLLIEARAKKTAIEAEKLTADNIYKVLIYFDKLYAVMDEQERRQLMESLISEIHIFEERKPNGQWLKSIKFKLPIIEEDMEISLDNETQVEAQTYRDGKWIMFEPKDSSLFDDFIKILSIKRKPNKK